MNKMVVSPPYFLMLLDLIREQKEMTMKWFEKLKII